MEAPVSQILAYKGTRVECVASTATVCEAVARMNDRNIGAVVVLDGERPIGIFTERDVLTRIVGRRLDGARTSVTEVMTRSLVTISPATTVHDAMRIVTDTRCRHLPVLHEGQLVGLISIGDLTRWVVVDQQRTIEDLTDYICRTG